MFGKFNTKLKFTGQLQMASLSLSPQFEINFMSDRKVIELLLQLKSAKTHGKNYIKVVRNLKWQVVGRLRHTFLSLHNLIKECLIRKS